jgi:hypothetical protein
MKKNKKIVLAEIWHDSDGDIWFDPLDQRQNIEQLQQQEQLTKFLASRNVQKTTGRKNNQQRNSNPSSHNRNIKTLDKKSKR